MLSIDEVKSIIKSKEAELSRQIQNGIFISPEYIQLQGALNGYIKNRPIAGILSILMPQSLLSDIGHEFPDKLYSIIDECNARTQNHIIFNKSLLDFTFEKHNYASTIQAGNVYRSLSSEYCIFLISRDGLHSILNGVDVGESVFFTKEAKRKNIQLKDMSELMSLFDEYRVRLRVRNTYRKFFVSNSHKKSLRVHLFNSQGITTSEDDFLVEYQHLLENKPEDRFRDDLRMFLSEKLDGNIAITKEHILESFKRIDIYIRDNFGENYLIEIKWVGTSIHSSGMKIGTSYDDRNIDPKAVQQTLGYLKELDSHNEDIKLGYLIVFDARKEDLPNTVDLFDQTKLTIEEKKYYSRFIKIDDFRTINSHPS